MFLGDRFLCDTHFADEETEAQRRGSNFPPLKVLGQHMEEKELSPQFKFSATVIDWNILRRIYWDWALEREREFG
jgi:hypothetical protein